MQSLEVSDSIHQLSHVNFFKNESSIENDWVIFSDEKSLDLDYSKVKLSINLKLN